MKNVLGKKRWTSIQSGFTLIELLIVMAIIGVLASLLLTSFIGVRERARDGRRKSDMSQIQAALEQYRADNAQYPSTLPACGATLGSGSSTYMQQIPCDPLGTGAWNNGSYLYNSTGDTYTLTFCVENGSDTDPHISTSLPSGVSENGTNPCTSSGGTPEYYTVSNP